VFAYAGREGRSFNNPTPATPAVIGRGALDAVNIYCRGGRLLRVRECVGCYTRHMLQEAALRRHAGGSTYALGVGSTACSTLYSTGPISHQWRRRACATMAPSPFTVNVAMAWRYDSRPHACRPWQHLFAAEIEGRRVPGTGHANRVLIHAGRSH
jgi:hypothetical protein